MIPKHSQVCSSLIVMKTDRSYLFICFCESIAACGFLSNLPDFHFMNSPMSFLTRLLVVSPTRVLSKDIIREYREAAWDHYDCICLIKCTSGHDHCTIKH